jgi:hypothetical protein
LLLLIGHRSKTHMENSKNVKTALFLDWMVIL